MQALAEGDLSERALQRAAELANDANLRMMPPKPRSAPIATNVKCASLKSDDRLPTVGSLIVRDYKGRQLQVQVLPKGFSFEGETYKSLSAVAKAITGTHCNGYHFFRLRQEDYGDPRRDHRVIPGRNRRGCRRRGTCAV